MLIAKLHFVRDKTSINVFVACIHPDCTYDCWPRNINVDWGLLFSRDKDYQEYYLVGAGGPTYLYSNLLLSLRPETFEGQYLKIERVLIQIVCLSKSTPAILIFIKVYYLLGICLARQWNISWGENYLFVEKYI